MEECRIQNQIFSNKNCSKTFKSVYKNKWFLFKFFVVLTYAFCAIESY